MKGNQERGHEFALELGKKRSYGGPLARRVQAKWKESVARGARERDAQAKEVALLRARRDSEWARLLDPARLDEVVAGIKAAGYLYVTLDLQGFRSGSMNDLLKVL